MNNEEISIVAIIAFSGRGPSLFIFSIHFMKSIVSCIYDALCPEDPVRFCLLTHPLKRQGYGILVALISSALV